jgi:RNA methyltransferase, TrmH family
MISKSQIKLISSLKLKKERYESGLFTVEGEKPVAELLKSGWPVELVLVRTDWFEKERPDWLKNSQTNIELISAHDMERMSHLNSASPVMAVARMNQLEWQWHKGSAGFVMVVDRLSDPGNLGTIIRIADWFGFQGVLCSPDTVDYYNSKTIQASMGSVFRMPVVYGELADWVSKEDPERVFATVLGGNPVNAQKFGTGGLLLIGSESHGLHPDLIKLAGHQVTIPGFGAAESLNAAVAAGIMASWVRLGQS